MRRTTHEVIGALNHLGTKRAQLDEVVDADSTTTAEIAALLGKIGGPQEDRTPDLCVANAALSQLS
jgi:hypothetical protein